MNRLRSRFEAPPMPSSPRAASRLLLLLATMATSCADRATGPASKVTPATPSPSVLPEAPLEGVAVQSEPWTLDAAAGQVLSTTNYRIYTTSSKEFLIDHLPAFVEGAAAHYRAALGPLPEPRSTMEIYLLDTRPQWERMTERFMGEQAATYLRIQKGGYSVEGRAILYDIGRRDTFTITAHEGWHVYTQRTFRHSLPVWLEEGVATYMEGFRWDPGKAALPTFLPWANFERYDQLRWGVRAGKLMSLQDLTRSTPQELIAKDANAALFYYAQVWALVHFLNEGEGGSHREGLRQLVADAAGGKLIARIRRDAGDRAASMYSYRRGGVDLLKIYTGRTAAELQPAYAAFMDQIVKTGTRNDIWQGKSPIREAASTPTAPAAPATP